MKMFGPFDFSSVSLKRSLNREAEPMTTDYDAKIEDFRKDQKWSELIAYCEGIRKQLQKAFPDGSMTDDDKQHWLSQVFGDMALAYTVLNMSNKAVAMAQKALFAQRRIQGDPVDLHFAYQHLASTLQAANRCSEATQAHLRSITCLLTPRQIEFLACGLEELGALRSNEEASNPGSVLQELARDLRHQRRWASANWNNRLSDDLRSERR